MMFNRCFCLLIILMMNYSMISMMLINRLRKEKTITFLSKFSSPIQMNLQQNSSLQILCSFYSNFHSIDLLWFHNGFIIQSFLSQNLNDDDDDSYLGVTIVSTLTISSIDSNEKGSYECVAKHKQISDRQMFDIEINSSDSSDDSHSFITVHTSEVLFESVDEILLICRVNSDECSIEWFDGNDRISNETDLILSKSDLNQGMNLFICEYCCLNQCQQLNSFIYSISKDENLL